MAVPKRKNSKARSKKRRAGHLKLGVVRTITCPRCGETMMPHRVCASCGFYRGKDVMHLESAE